MHVAVGGNSHTYLASSEIILVEWRLTCCWYNRIPLMLAHSGWEGRTDVIDPSVDTWRTQLPRKIIFTHSHLVPVLKRLVGRDHSAVQTLLCFLIMTLVCGLQKIKCAKSTSPIKSFTSLNLSEKTWINISCIADPVSGRAFGLEPVSAVNKQEARNTRAGWSNTGPLGEQSMHLLLTPREI